MVVEIVHPIAVGVLADTMELIPVEIIQCAPMAGPVVLPNLPAVLLVHVVQPVIHRIVVRVTDAAVLVLVRITSGLGELVRRLLSDGPVLMLVLLPYRSYVSGLFQVIFSMLQIRRSVQVHLRVWVLTARQ